MLIFGSEDDVDEWCAFRGIPRGGTMSPEQCWRMAREWYSEKLSPDWRRKTPEEAEEMLARIGLTDPFWNLRA